MKQGFIGLLTLLIKAMKKTSLGFVLFLLTTNYSINTLAQACCSGGVPISNNIGARTVEQSVFSIRLNYDANILKSFYTGNEKLGDGTIKRFSQSSFLHAIYGGNNRVSVNTVFSYVNHRRSLVNSTEQTSVSGVGDIVLLLQFGIITKPRHSLFIGIGPKIPIGKNELKDQSGIVFATDLQPGTGSWDAIANIGYTRQGFLKQGMNFSAIFISKINTHSDRFNGAQRYKYGNDFQLLSGISDSHLIKKIILEPGLFFRFWHRTEDFADDFPFPNTGGSWMYIVPIINIKTVVPDISVFLSSEIPIYQDLNGTQLSTTIRFSVGLQYNLKLKRN